MDACHVCGRTFGESIARFDCSGGGCCEECTDVFFINDLEPTYEACKVCQDGPGTIWRDGEDKPAEVQESWSSS